MRFLETEILEFEHDKLDLIDLHRKHLTPYTVHIFFVHLEPFMKTDHILDHKTISTNFKG